MSGSCWNKSETRRFKQELVANGYKMIRQTGSHYIFKHPSGDEITINNSLNKMVMQRLKKQMLRAGVTINAR